MSGKTTRELQGEHAAAFVAYQRLSIEIMRGYRKDPIGLDLCNHWLKDIRIFLDDIEGPLQEAADFEEVCDLRGKARFVLETVNRKLNVLIPLKQQLEGKTNYLIAFGRRATDVSALG